MEYNEQVQRLIEKTPGVAVSWWLMAAYAYYHLHNNILSDNYYDFLSKFIYENWDKIEHRHKHLIRKSYLKDMSSAFYLNEEDYPGMAKSCAQRAIEGQIIFEVEKPKDLSEFFD